MSIFASKCPFFSSTIEIVRNLKISKLQLAIEFSDGLGSWYKVCSQFFHFDPFLDKRFGFSHEHGSWYKYVIDFSIMTVILEMGCLDIPTTSAHGTNMSSISPFRQSFLDRMFGVSNDLGSWYVIRSRDFLFDNFHILGYHQTKRTPTKLK